MGNKISKYSMFNPFYKKINKSDDVDKNKEDDKILKHNDDAILSIILNYFLIIYKKFNSRFYFYPNIISSR